MKTRNSVRLLLFDPHKRLLLIKINKMSDLIIDPRSPITEPVWITIGGKIEEGEDITAAALREAKEETGIDNIKIERAIWYGEYPVLYKGELTLLKETFVIATTNTTVVQNKNLTADEEQKLITEYKWWTLEELQITNETILPEVLIPLLPNVIKKNYPATLITINLGKLE